MYALVLALCLICFGSSFADECVKGEHFWCSSMENALKCNALKHCAATVWKNEISNGNIQFDNCKMCTDFLENAKIFLQDKTTRQAVKVLLKEELCPLFGEFEATCRVAIEHYADQLFDLIASEIDPKVICHFLHFCPENKLKFKIKTVEEALKMPNNAVTCELCKIFIDRLKEFIGSEPTKEKLEEALEKLCHLVPKSMKDTCDHFVKTYADLLFQLILDNLESGKICEELNLCKHLETQDGRTYGCINCMLVMSFLGGAVNETSTVEEIKKAINMVCEIAPKQSTKECEILRDENTPFIIEAVTNQIRPHQACVKMGKCIVSKRRYFKCIAGPKYWCASEANARLCQAEEHCKKFAWV